MQALDLAIRNFAVAEHLLQLEQLFADAARHEPTSEYVEKLCSFTVRPWFTSLCFDCGFICCRHLGFTPETTLDMLKKQYIVFNMKDSQAKTSLGQAILTKVHSKGRNWAFTPADFATLGDPRSVGMALTRLMRGGRIRRIGRGLYDRPHRHPLLGQVGATADAVVDALKRGRHLRILPSPQVAANQLGLTTQVPARMIYQTDGAPARICLGKQEIVFRRNTGRNLALADRTSGWVAQALRAVGKDHVTPEIIQHLRERLDAPARKELLADRTKAPAWMRPIFEDIAHA